MSDEVSIRSASEHVSLVEFSRPPHNYFDATLIQGIADAYEELDRSRSCRAIVLCSDGKNFCAGANFAGPNPAEGALELLYTGARVRGEDAHAIGLCDRLASSDRLREEAVAFAEEIAISSPLALRAIRQTMRGDLAERIRAATEHEAAEQATLFGTEDFREDVAAAAQRRPPRFRGR